jgi:uncharacterized membrane protein
MLDLSERIADATAQAAQLEEQLADPALAGSTSEFARVAKELSTRTLPGDPRRNP